LLAATVARPRRTLFATLALVVLSAAGCSSSQTSPFVPPETSRPPVVRFVGPTELTRPASFAASARAFSSRIVAVTFRLDGRPLGTDTTRPYRLDVDPALLAAGRHRIRVVAVDSLGRRTSSRAKTVTVAPSASSVVHAAPGESFARAREALRNGDVTVKLAPGRYEIQGLRLGSGARLVGSGPGTVLAPPPGARYWAVVVARGTRIRISDLTVDGGGGPAEASSSTGGIAIAVFDGSHDVRLQRLRVLDVRTDGVSVWGEHSGVSVQDSVIEGDGTAHAGVYSLGSDRSRDTSVIRTRIHGFRGYGILLGQKEYGRPSAGLHGLALDNEISDIRDPARDDCVTHPVTADGCGTNEGGIWTGGVAASVIGNTIRRARWDGIETVGSSTRTTIVGNRIRDTRTGIYLEHSTNDSLIARNLIVDAETGINVEWLHDGVGSRRNTFLRNRVVRAESGLFLDVGSDGNTIVGNVFVSGERPAITLQGSSGNVVRDNVGCGAPTAALVELQSARWENGTVADSTANRLEGNRSVARC
jgi:parallel beta-helix repeat protein